MTDKSSAQLNLRIETLQDGALERLFQNPIPKPGQRIIGEHGVTLEFIGQARGRDVLGSQIIDLVIHIPSTVAAHLVAVWLYEAIRGVAKLTHEGKPVKIDEQSIRKLIQDLLDALRKR